MAVRRQTAYAIVLSHRIIPPHAVSRSILLHSSGVFARGTAMTVLRKGSRRCERFEPLQHMRHVGLRAVEAHVAPEERSHHDVAEAEGGACEPVVAGEPGIRDLERVGRLLFGRGSRRPALRFSGGAAHGVHEQRDDMRGEGLLLPFHPLLGHGEAAVVGRAQHARRGSAPRDSARWRSIRTW